MFSRKTAWSFAPNRLASLLDDKRRTGERVLDLTGSNPTRARLDYPVREILDALRDPRAAVYEPAPRGLDDARRAVATYYAERGKRVSPDDVLLTASTSEAYAFLFKILFDPGDSVVIPRPSYPLFDYLARLESVEVASYPLDLDGGAWSLDTRALEETLGPQARAVLVVHPGNPTGSYLNPSEIDSLVDLCRRRDLALIVDEVFFDYLLEEDPRAVSSLVGESSALTFVLSGLSKVAGLPQMKLSWIAMSGPESSSREAARRLEHVSDVFLSVAAPVQHALAFYLETARNIRPCIATRTKGNLKQLRDATRGTPIDVPTVGGGWCAVLRLPAVQSSEDWALELLTHDDVYVHPGYLFDFPVEACLVVSLLTPPEVFIEGIDRLLHCVDRRLNRRT